MLNGAVTGRALWNEWTGTTWQTTEVGNNDFVLYHIFAVNDDDDSRKVISVMGQNDYPTVGQARSGASTEIASILTQYPFEEVVPVGTIIFQTSTGYANTVQSRVRSNDDGDDYTDWRSTELAQGVAASSHQNLTNLELAGTGVTFGHIDDQAQTIYGAKTFNDALAASNLTGTNTGDQDLSTYATLTGTETLTNKTLTSPKVNEDVIVTSTSTELNILD